VSDEKFMEIFKSMEQDVGWNKLLWSHYYCQHYPLHLA
jgi:hypothetical protein